ncbi:MAG: 4-hydroxy-3-methylbut-2-enyl diphosphate reductase [Bacteroidales bacterium]
MKVTIDPDSGFCFGVNHAIQLADNELSKGKPLFCLGEMVHNQVQMDLLKAKGLNVVFHSDLKTLKGNTILVRAHGEPPATFASAKQLDIQIIDATCPIVTKLQKKISQSFNAGQASNAQIVIFGKPGHAEVAGLNGNAGNVAIIVNNEADLVKIDFTKPVRLFSQTTMDAELYQAIAALIQSKMNESGNSDLFITKSVCKQVSGRTTGLKIFAARHDVVLFVAGNNSANGAYLFSICKQANTNSHYISNLTDIESHWFVNCNSVGVSGATSTPGWLIEEVADYIQTLKIYS